jgi:hypothetical protein
MHSKLTRTAVDTHNSFQKKIKFSVMFSSSQQVLADSTTTHSLIPKKEADAS